MDRGTDRPSSAGRSQSSDSPLSSTDKNTHTVLLIEISHSASSLIQLQQSLVFFESTPKRAVILKVIFKFKHINQIHLKSKQKAV